VLALVSQVWAVLALVWVAMALASALAHNPRSQAACLCCSPPHTDRYTLSHPWHSSTDSPRLLATAAAAGHCSPIFAACCRSVGGGRGCECVGGVSVREVGECEGEWVGE
jgi:hypothetical protein